MSKTYYDANMNAGRKAKRLAGFIVFALAAVFCFSVSPLVYGCAIEDYYFTYTSDFYGPCGAYMGDSIIVEVKVSFWETDVGETVQAMAHVGTPCRLASGNPVYSTNYGVTSSDVGTVKTFYIELTSMVTGDGPGIYTIADAGVLNVSTEGYICGSTVFAPSGCTLLGVEMRSSSVKVKVGAGGGRIDVERTAPTQMFLGSVTSTTGKIFDFNLNDTMKATAYPDRGNTFTSFQNLNTGEVSAGNPITWVITWAGMNTLTGNFTGDSNPPPPGAEIGSSCEVVEQYFFGNPFYNVRYRDGNTICSWDSERDDAIYCGQGRTQCYDLCLQDFTFMIDGSTADVDHNCFAGSAARIETEIVAYFYYPHTDGRAVYAVSTIKFPDETRKDYYSAAYYPSGGGYENITTTITRSDIIESNLPYIFERARVVDQNNNVLFDSGSWSGGRCVVLSTMEANAPPFIPYDPSPKDGAAVGPPVTLSWKGGDPDPGDTVTYQVYLGSSSNSQALQTDSDSSDTSCGISGLVLGGVYYWHVVATDNHGVSAIGPTWTFSYRVLISLTILSDVVTTYRTPVTIQAELKRTDTGAPVNGKSIMFYIGYNQGFEERENALTGKNCDGSEGAAGVANLCYMPSPFMGAGTYSIEAKFQGDADYGAATASPKVLIIDKKSATLTCDFEDTLDYIFDGIYDPPTATAFWDKTIQLGALLKSGGLPVDGVTVNFYHELFFDSGGNPITAPIGSATTGSAGWAIIDWIPTEEDGEGNPTIIWVLVRGSNEIMDIDQSAPLIIRKGISANEPPNAPINPNPKNGAVNVGRYNEYSQFVVDLSWQCTDPDEDPLTYDVYLDKKIDETTQPTTKVNSGPLTVAHYTFSPLIEGAAYVWKVIPKDDSGLIPADLIPVWSFTANKMPGKVYYVSTLGLDSWTGCRRVPVESDGYFYDGPWATITKAAATMAAGDTAVVLAGNYSNEHIVFANGGVDWNNPITLEAKGEVIIDGGISGVTGIKIDGKGYIIIQGSFGRSRFNIYNYDKGIHIANSTSIMVMDCNLVRNGNGISLTGTTYTTIHNNNISDSNRTGVILGASSNNNSINENNIYNSTLANVSDSGTGNTWLNNYYGDYPDYTGPDLNADGFGDIAYTFTTGSDAKPLMDPIEPPTTIDVILQVAP